MKKIFFDTEFTGLHQKTTLISLGMISDCGKTFYAEFTDFDISQVNDWIQDNVLRNLILGGTSELRPDSNILQVRGDSGLIKKTLISWLAQFTKSTTVEFWSDCLAYDWVLLNGLLSDYSEGYPSLPNNISYIPFDLCTLLKTENIDPDINREDFSELPGDRQKHNALWDAKVIKACYERLIM